MIKEYKFKGFIRIPAIVSVEAETLDEAFDRIGEPDMPTRNYTRIVNELSRNKLDKADFEWGDEQPTLNGKPAEE